MIKSVKEDINGFGSIAGNFSKHWHEICEFLYAQQIGYNCNYTRFDELCREKEFFRAYKRVFIAGEDSLRIQAKSIQKLKRFIYEPDKTKIKPDRFIPKIEYASLNRMNDVDRVYNYLVSDFGDLPDYQIRKTGLMELRATNSTDVWSCNFNIKPAYHENELINLSSEYRLPTKDNEIMEFLEQKYREACFKNGKHSAGEKEVEYYVMQICIKIIEHSDIFAPIDKTHPCEEQRKKYKPFHFLCNYYESKGYIGLLFRSTVNTCGVNLVLFDPKYADCDFTTCEHTDLES